MLQGNRDRPQQRARAFILNGGYDGAKAEADLAAGLGDFVAFGKPFIANPDLVAKLKSGAALRPADPATFFTPGEAGYTVHAEAA